MIDGMFVFDAHSHVFGPMETIWGVTGQTAETWLERMDRNHIDMAQIMGGYSLLPEDQRNQNDVIIDSIKKYPDKFIGFMFASPLWGHLALDEMKRCADNGIRGLKLYAHGHGNYFLDDPIVDPLIHLAHELNWIVMAHTDIDSKVCNTHIAVRLANRHPDVKFIFAHMGMNSDVTYHIPDYVKDAKNVYLDSSDSPNIPELVFKRSMSIMPDRILFGTDAPSLSPEVELTKLEVAAEYCGLTKEEKREVLGGNAVRLFNINISKYKSG